MDIAKKTKEEVEDRLHKIERLIAKKGIGSSYLSRAERVQRNVNLALFVGGIFTLTGLTIWAFSKAGSPDEE